MKASPFSLPRLATVAVFSGLAAGASADVLSVSGADVVGGVSIWRGLQNSAGTAYLMDSGGAGGDTTGILDQQTGQQVSDLVGSTTAPTFYIGYGTISSVDYIGFRVRLNAFPAVGAVKQVTYIGFDFNANGVADMVVGADLQPEDSTKWSTVISDVGTGTNTSPSTTTIAYSGYSNTDPLNGALYRHTVTAGYGNKTATEAAVTGGTNPYLNWQTVTNSNATVGGNINVSGDADAFLTFAVPYADFVSAIQSTGIMGSGFTFTPNTQFRITAATSNQANALNQDNMGPEAVAFNWSAPVSAALPVPEPSTAVILGALFAPLALRRRRRA